MTSSHADELNPILRPKTQCDLCSWFVNIEMRPVARQHGSIRLVVTTQVRIKSAEICLTT